MPKIIALVDRLFPPKIAPEAKQEAPKDDGLLIVNERLQIACRIQRDPGGYFTLFSFDQITRNEFQRCDENFSDCGMAIAEARRLIHVNGPIILREIAAESAPMESKKEEPVLTSASGM